MSATRSNGGSRATTPFLTRLLFRFALLCYPRRFRARYGAAMREGFADGRAEAGLRGSVLRHDARALIDLLVNGLRERLHPTFEQAPPATPGNARPTGLGTPPYRDAR